MNNPQTANIRPITSSASTATGSDLLHQAVGVMSGKLRRFLSARFIEPEESMGLALDFLAHFSQGIDENAVSVKELVAKYQGSPLARLCEGFNISESELQLLILCAMAQHHEGFADVYKLLHPLNQPRLTVALAAQLLTDDDTSRIDFMSILSGADWLVRGLVCLQGEGPINSRSLIMPSKYWRLLCGTQVDSQFVYCRPAHRVGLKGWFKNRAVKHAERLIRNEIDSCVMVFAHNTEAAFYRALALVDFLELEVLCLDLRAVGETDNRAQHALIEHFYWSCILSGASALIVLPEAENQPELGLLAQLKGHVVLCGQPGQFPEMPNRTNIHVPIDKLTSSESRQMWQSLLPELKDQWGVLASRYPVEPYYAKRIADEVKALASKTGQKMSLEIVDAFFRNSHGANLPDCVSLIEARLGWQQLVLPEGQEQQLKEAIHRLLAQQKVVDEWKFLAERRGAKGVKLLFSGPPGTGKTLSAEVLANALNTELLVVDISRLVSKWVGETEKNLAKVFNQAEQMHAVLFFDEADAIFGKRTEVSDAHDRYANLETAYLLSRLETYDGLAILATNYRNNIDAAFIRRLDFIVEFREPSSQEREKLWRCHVPDEAPLAEDVNFNTLAGQFPMVGGEIRNAAVRAAYLAVQAVQQQEEVDTEPPHSILIHQEHFIQAIRREYEKSGKAFREVKTP